MTVTDPGSYTYYVEQIKVMEAEFKNLQEQLETAQDIYGQTVEVYDQLHGVYSMGLSLSDKLQAVQAELTSVPSGASGFAGKWESLLRKYGDFDTFNDVDDFLKVAFPDVREFDFDDQQPWKHIDLQYQVRQEALKAAIERSEQAQAELGEAMDNLAALTAQIDQTQSLKESQDLTNRFLAEILLIMQKLYGLTGALGEAQALLSYKGVSDEGMTASESKKNGNKSIDLYYLQDKMIKRGSRNPGESDPEKIWKTLEAM
ncbi:uncharacterized protein DFE_A0056 (plasmid) [Desulfovibrio ferrophilus]|uniref:Uncharacterized protein n=2 Tax=Desulfovibrio ferrophilus TaxID=241368 RepID=A0A2Z6B3T0_9BACT|nr:uncharacterized protein DFE_A0056 [Desulfovibrio ferrophilus]